MSDRPIRVLDQNEIDSLLGLDEKDLTLRALRLAEAVIMGNPAPDATHALKAVQDAIDEIERKTPKPLPADATRAQVFQAIRDHRVSKRNLPPEFQMFGRSVISDLLIGCIASRRSWGAGRWIQMGMGDRIIECNEGRDPAEWYPTLDDILAADWETGD